jgi:HSP20 family protein
MDRVRRHFGRLLDDDARGRGPRSPSSPRAAIFDAGAAFVVEVEVPGFGKADVQVSVDKDVVTLTGARALPPQREGYSAHRRERADMRLARSFALPARIDAERVDATLQNGVLTVTLPKAAEDKPRAVDIRVK